MQLTIALRNVLRNRRRTLLNVTMIAGSFAAIVIFQGFAHNLVGKLQAVATKAQFGHVQVAANKSWHLSSDDLPKDRMLASNPDWLAKIKTLAPVESVSARISFYGLVTSGEQSLSARGIAFDPEIERELRDSLPIIEGEGLKSSSTFSIVIGSGLQEQLGAKVGGNVTLLSYTFDGSVNAVDADLVGVFKSGLAEVDNSTFYTALPLAQRLLDTSAVERYVIILKQTSQTDEALKSIQAIIPTDVEAKPWYELATYYRQVVEYFRVQNFIVEWIILLLAMLAIGNTVGMSISERTGEIGTIRAMGDSVRKVMAQFFLEGVVLGALGGVTGCLLSLVLAIVLNRLQVPITTPGASKAFPMEIDLVGTAFLQAFALTFLIAVGATLIPAYRAARLAIVDALKRNY